MKPRVGFFLVTTLLFTLSLFVNAQENLTVGFIYVGPKDDFGYNQAHAEGAAALKELPGVTVVEEEQVPETVDVQKTMESMINLDGATLLFPTSFGYYDPHVKEMSAKYPDVTFLHAGGLWKDGDPVNAGSYFGYIDEAEYISGIVAGMTTKTNKLGFIAAKPIPQVLRNINSFTLGARSVNPEVTTTVIFTGEWSLPVKEAEAANALIDQDIDVLTMHVDSPKVVVETAEKRGIFVTGYHMNQAALAPNGYLTGAEWNWPGLYTQFASSYLEGGEIGNFVRGGFKESIIKMSDYGAAVSEEAKAKAEEVKAQFMDGTFVIYKGPLMDNAGNEVIPAGTEYGQTAIELESMNYLVEGVIGTIPQ